VRGLEKAQGEKSQKEGESVSTQALSLWGGRVGAEIERTAGVKVTGKKAQLSSNQTLRANSMLGSGLKRRSRARHLRLSLGQADSGKKSKEKQSNVRWEDREKRRATSGSAFNGGQDRVKTPRMNVTD